MTYPPSFWHPGLFSEPIASSFSFFRKLLNRIEKAATDPAQRETSVRLREQLTQIEHTLFSPDPYLTATGEQQWRHWLRSFARLLEPIETIATSARQPEESPYKQETSTVSAYRPVPIGQHQLPPLPYPYDALEPYIDETTMCIHHQEHHKKYVEDLNKAETQLAHARQTGDFSLIKHWERELAFNGAGHYLHTLFWESMSPRGGGEPSGALKKQIIHDFGSFEAFKKQFSEAAEKVEGGGWAILVWSPRAHRLEILQAEKHQNLSQQDIVPLLPLDVWEHAYYLKYPNKRRQYIDAWWHVVNWPQVYERFCKARQLRWHPY
ncbi:Superoxide dismutase [Laceyella tengchongensis]|jgi:superoxide dismutase|uniref:superoxide dismutase n=1 Tax=Laceyella tengchongensis TaxID=574699 RepID=A0AA46AGL1_9BACL|nr:superoxide dismutase [Laceyella tengchongensis]SMP29153.1 Superoxide dismutase [Laceyella tengchongensis]